MKISRGFFAIIMIMFLTAYAANAQTAFEYKESPKVSFDVNSGQSTGETFVVSEKEFDIFATQSGTKYVKAISVKGNTYPVWIYEKTDQVFEDKSVYKTRNGSYCVYILNKNGYPIAKWLKPTN